MLAEAGATTGVSSAVEALSLGDKPVEGLAAELELAKKEMEAAMTNSFDTPAAMRIISELIRKTNIHVAEHKSDMDVASVEAAARWVTKIVGILGLDANAKPPYDGIGWVSAEAAANKEPAEAVRPYKEVYATVTKDVQSLGLTDSEAVASLLSQSPTLNLMPSLRLVPEIRRN